MSYCRWSSDDFQCDVYVYESVYGGFQTHVASGRHVKPEPFVEYPDLSVFIGYKDGDAVTDEMRAAQAQYRAYMDQWRDDEVRPIDLPEAGATFGHETADECADNLERLRDIGFNVPQYAIDRLREEASE